MNPKVDIKATNEGVIWFIICRLLNVMVGASFLSQFERYSLRIDHSEDVAQNLLEFPAATPNQSFGSICWSTWCCRWPLVYNPTSSKNLPPLMVLSTCNSNISQRHLSRARKSPAPHKTEPSDLASFCYFFSLVLLNCFRKPRDAIALVAH